MFSGLLRRLPVSAASVVLGGGAAALCSGEDASARPAAPQLLPNPAYATLQPDQKAAALECPYPNPPWEESTLEQLRAGCTQALGALAAHPKAQAALAALQCPPESLSIDIGQSRVLPARVYRPKPAAAATAAPNGGAPSPPPPLLPPVIMFFHGGGFAICDPISNFDYAAARLATATGCVVVSVQYRQAPEHPFPAAPLDCYAATRWVAAHAAARLGADGARLATCGDSAGGNLAAVVALMARDEGAGGEGVGDGGGGGGGGGCGLLPLQDPDDGRLHSLHKRPKRGLHPVHATTPQQQQQHQQQQQQQQQQGAHSAGHAAGAGLHLLHAPLPPPVVSLQICLCPVTDWSFATPSYAESWRSPVPQLDGAHMAWYARRYLPVRARTEAAEAADAARGVVPDILHPYAAPLRAPSLAGVAAAIVINASHDPLRSEGEAYGARLAEAGRLIRCETYAGTVHDWYLHFDWAGVDEFWEELGREVRAHFAGAPAP